MSSPSIGVTNVVFVRWTMSWVIRSPSCSASSISRARPLSSGHPWSISCSSFAARSVFCPDSLKRSKKTLSRGTRLGSRTSGKLPIREDLGDPSSGVSVPELRGLRLLRPVHRCSALPKEVRDLRNALGIEAQQRVRPRSNGHGPLGVGAQREAGNAEVRRLLLDPAGVGEHRGGLRLQG